MSSMHEAWNGKWLLNTSKEHLTKEQRALCYVANCLEGIKREFFPHSSIMSEINRIQSIALEELYKEFPDEIKWVGCGYYQLNDFREE